jgi:hypothetical protein
MPWQQLLKNIWANCRFVPFIGGGGGYEIFETGMGEAWTNT